MTDQLDLFAPIDVPETMRQVHTLAAAFNAAIAQATAVPAHLIAPDPDTTVYSIVPLRFGKDGTVGINWRRGPCTGVIGGLYKDADDAQAVIDANRATWDAGVLQRRQWPAVCA